MEAEKNKTVFFEDNEVGEIKPAGMDMSVYIGREAKIDSYEKKIGEHGYYLILKTEAVDLIGEDKWLYATRILSLDQDINGKIGWGANSPTAIYLKKMGVMHYKDLIGKTVKVQTRLNKKDGREYLTF